MNNNVVNTAVTHQLQNTDMTMGDILLHVVEKVAMVALVLFTFADFPIFFAIGFVIGWTWRVLTIVEKQKMEEPSPGWHHEEGLEKIAGVTFPRIMRVGIEIATLWCHVEHHAPVFAPLVGFSAGAWLGKYTTWVYRWGATEANKYLNINLPT